MSSFRGRPRIPEHGIKATLCGGNTIGGTIREREARADGYRHIDTPALVRRLVEMNVNTYLYGVWDSPTDWDDLREEFLPAAHEAGIDVIPYIVPPSETTENGRASRPFMTDYVAWARAIAELSVRYPNLVSWAIDDFEIGDNALLFTPDYMERIKRAQADVNPDLGFYTCAYIGKATDPAFLDKYAPFIDGIIYPYLDGRNENTTITSSLRDCIAEIRTHTEPRDLQLILLVYTGRFLDAPLPPTEDYVRETVGTGVRLAAEEQIAGVVAYGTQQDGAPAPATDNRAMYGNGRLALFASRKPVTPGQQASAVQEVRVDPRSPRYELSFWFRREFVMGNLKPGDYRLQVALDDDVVWDFDVVDQPQNLWLQGDAFQGPIDVTPAVAGKATVRLTFRLVATTQTEHAFVDVGVDNLETVGLHVVDPGFEEPGTWELHSEGSMVATIDVFAADRPHRILSTLRDVFAAEPHA
ncbi:hypothetical protein [Jiangella rhizosphaerae]|uniref:hypothetical protein n=1 Tax=Jiangella rhizosphaerae TaxID=2293569 RepID=UPI001314E014|nr:hypothetical protein [Jiangella rhizosphaerae]